MVRLKPARRPPAKGRHLKISPIEEELKRAKGDLEDLEFFIRDFTSFLPLAVCTVNPLGIIIDVNKAFSGLSGYKSIEIMGEFLIKIFLEEEELEKTLNTVMEKEFTISKELNLISRQKEKIPVSVAISSRKDKEGNFIGYFVGITDISELKRLQEEIEGKVKERTGELEEARTALMNMLEDVEEARSRTEEEKNKTLAVITNFADGLLVFDEENRLSLINPQAEKFFDVKAQDLIGRPVLELSAFPALEPLIGLLGREIRDLFRKEILIKKNLTLEVSTVSMLREEGRLGTLVILHDITREKIVERMKTEFVSLAAHQLRTPLSAIKWTLRMLLDGDLGEITKEQKDFISKTYKSNERMIALINDLLDVTRVEEGRYVYKPILTEFESIVQFVVNSYKEEIERKKLKLEFKKPEKKLPQVMLDVEKMRLAIQNLLDNAIRYTPTGGKVVVSLKGDKKEIEFSVRDTGIGIPRDQKERVFTKFFRGANVMRMETEGSGLGLFITKNIVEAHGGKVWFESEENVGTTFHFIVPVQEEFSGFLKEF